MVEGRVAAGRALVPPGSAALVAQFAYIVRRRPDLAHGVMGLGALAFLGGNLVWLAGAPLARATAWWLAFLVLTIAGERLELAHIAARGARVMRGFVVSLAVFLACLALGLFAWTWGVRVLGAGAVLLAAWLLRHDLARRTIRERGLARVIAACLLPGYAWLALAGVLWIVMPARFDFGPAYDAMVHAVLVGFVFSMILTIGAATIPGVHTVADPDGFFRCAEEALRRGRQTGSAVVHYSMLERAARAGAI